MGFMVVNEQLEVIPFTNRVCVNILFFRENAAELVANYLHSIY